MAGGIKGIIVKIGGDTTELGRALTSASKQSTALQKELKGVNTLLKMDPRNVTLLKQKQELLTKSIQETENKLKSLKEVLAKADSGEIKLTEEEYRNLQREIASTEVKLKSLKDQQKDFGSVGAQVIAEYGEKLQDIGSKIEDVGKKFSVLSGASGAVLTASTKLASDYGNAVAKVGTIADTSSVTLERLSDDMIQLSTDTGKSATEIAEATYQAISASVDTADAVSFVGTASNLAKAGFLETADAVDVLTTIINAYGLEATDAARLSDMLVQTQNDGKTTVNELAHSLGQVIPVASAYGVNMENLSAAYAQLTKNGVNTANSTTYIRSMLSELGDTGSNVSSILQEKTGKSFGKLMEDGYSLGDVLGILQESVGGDSEAFANLWGNARAGTGALALLSSGVDAFNEELGNMGDSTGNVSNALDTLNTPSAKLNKSINALKNTGIELGAVVLTAITPMLQSLAEKLQGLFTWFSNLSPTMQKIIVVILAVVTAIGPLLIGIGKLISAVGTIMTFAPKILSGVKVIGTGLKALWGIIAANPVIAIITAVIAILVLLYTKCEWFRNGVKAVISAVINFFVNFRDNVKKIITVVANTITNVWNGIKSTTTKVWTAIKTAVMTPINAVKSTVSSVFSTIKSTITNVWNAIKSTTTSVWNSIKSAITSPIQSAKSTVENVINTIKSKVKNIFSGIKPKLHLSLPRVSVSGGKAPWGIAGKGSLPSFHVSWNKLGAIFNRPTIFDTHLGYQGVGEAGPEAVAPISTLMGYVQGAVDNSALVSKISTLEQILDHYLPVIADKDPRILLDSGELVGGIVGRVDGALADRNTKLARGW